MLRCLLVLVSVVLTFSVKGQNFSNKGKEFWVGYGYHQAMVDPSNTNLQDMVLYFTSDINATVKVEIPALGWVRTYNVVANGVTESAPMPKTGSQDSRLITEGLYNTGIHITSDKPVVAYAHIYNQNVSGATLLFPVNTLGQDYYSLNFTQRSNSPQSNSWAYVIATEDSTYVEITPSKGTLTHSAGVPFVVTLNKGQIYNLMGTTNNNFGVDLTGTRIRSINTGTSGCKKIAVFSGSGRVSITCNSNTASSDNFIQQVFPRNAWGKKFLTVPTEKLKNNFFRVAVSDPATIVKFNGITATGIKDNFYYEFMTNEPQNITADQPIMVAQYITSTDGNNNQPTCGNSNNHVGDPEMIYISPVEQTIDKITLNSTSHYSINSHYINVVIKTAAVSGFTLDGVNKSSSFVSHPKDPLYSYGVFTVSPGRHTLKADSGFNAIAYGYGTYESYGYNAGTNLKDLNQFLTIQNQFQSVNFPATCQNASFALSVTLPYLPSTMTWDFSSNPNMVPNATVTRTNPAPDSTYVRDGITLYVFKIPGLYKYTAVGTYPVKITTVTLNTGGCSGQQELDFEMEVTSEPVADFTIAHAGCPIDPVTFTDASSSPGRTVTKYHWDFGDATFDTAKNVVKTFTATGNYLVEHSAINDIGCAASTSKPLTIDPRPVADFILPASACVNNPVTIRDTSTIAAGSITKWYWNYGNGDSLTKTNNSPVTPTYKTSGAFDVKLVVENSRGCKSLVKQKTITIFPDPIASFSTPAACISDPFVTFRDSSYLPGFPTVPLSYQWNFDDPNATPSNPNTSFVKNPQHTYTVAGIYRVSLTVSTSDGCSATIIKPVTVNDAPIADFSIIRMDTLCSGKQVIIKNTSTIGTGSISKLEIRWDSVNAPGVIETDAAVTPGKNYNHLYPTSAIPKVYKISFKAFSGTTCISEKVKEITVHPSPVLSFDPVAPFCLSAGSRVISEVKETSGITGSYLFAGPGITPIGNFTPSIAGVGKHTIQYIFTSAPGCTDSVSGLVEVENDPTVDLPGKINVLEGGSVNFQPITTGNIIKYQWSPTLFLSNANIENPISTPKSNINYRLTVNTSGGCSATDTVGVFILNNPVIPNIFSPNGDGVNDFWNIGSLSSYADCTVDVYNRFGQPVFHSTGYSRPWNGANVPAGVYYYIINPGNGKKPFTGTITIIR